MALKKTGTPEKIKIVKEPTFQYDSELTTEVTVEPKNKKKKDKK